MNLHTDFWNFSRYSCACDFCDRSTLLCIVARAASTGVKSPVAVDAIWKALWRGRVERLFAESFQLQEDRLINLILVA